MSVIGVDFDGTIAKWADYPNIGELVPYAREIINRLYASGHMIVVWTCRGGMDDLLTEWLSKHEIRYHHINSRPLNNIVCPSPKLIADVYIDDKSAYCPLVPQLGGKPYVDWLAIDYWLRDNGYYVIPL